MAFCIQAKQCATCIYRKDCALDIKVLEDAIRDPYDDQFFATYRQCHHSDSACCRGFWDRHKDNFPLGQMMQRLNGVKFVEHDTLK